MPPDKSPVLFPADDKKIFIIALIIFVVLTLASYASFRYAKDRTPTIVLPGGITYLGPSDSPAAGTTPASSQIPVDANAKWSLFKGKIFPYAFSYPSNLALGVFPNDSFDSVTIFWGNTDPQKNLLLRIEDLNKIPNMKKYIGLPKKNYVQDWWKQYGLGGVGTISGFTNNQGLVGFRARFAGTNFDNIFFEVPGRPDLVIWMASKLLDQTTFDKIVDSLSWKK